MVGSVDLVSFTCILCSKRLFRQNVAIVSRVLRFRAVTGVTEVPVSGSGTPAKNEKARHKAGPTLKMFKYCNSLGSR
jgi:hypothetical protein